MLKKLFILSDGNSGNTGPFEGPFFQFRNFLKDNSVAVSIKRNGDNLEEADCYFVNSKFFRKKYPVWDDKSVTTIRGFLDSLRRLTNNVVWFDTSDSCSSNQFAVIDNVNLFCKNQIYNEKEMYLQSFYGGRIYTDFYHRRYGVCDNQVEFNHNEYIPKANDLNKIVVSWNSSFGEYGFGIINRLNRRFNNRYARVSRIFTKLGDPRSNRQNAISCRIGVNHLRQTVRFQRERLSEILASSWKVSTERINKRQYFLELLNSQVGISPYGWGEIAYRDFEIFISGAALFKPSMSHVKTWPDIYVDGETFVSYAWDLSDIDEKLHYLSEATTSTEIAQRGQETYLNSVHGRDGAEQFCKRVLSIISGDRNAL